MADTYELLLKLGADVGEIKTAQAELVRLQRDLQGVGAAIKQGLSFGVGSRIVDGIARIPSYISASVSAYARQEAAEAGLANAMRATGLSAAENIETFKQMAAEIQRATVIGDEQVLELQKMALNMGVSKERMRECIEGAIGLQHAYGMGLNEALKASAAVLQGNTQRLNELIPALRNCKDDEERLAMASQAMRNGFAQAQDETKTLRGALAQLSNAWGDVSEVVGSAVAPVVKEFASLLKILAEALANNRGGTVFLTRAIVALMAALALSKMARYLSAIKGITAAKIADTVATVANTAAVNANTGAQAANATAAAKVAHAITASRAVLMALGTTTVGFGVIVAGVLASVAFAWSRIEGEIQKVKDAENEYVRASQKHSEERLGKIEKEYNALQKFGAEFDQISKFSQSAEYEMQRAVEMRQNLQRQGLKTDEIDKHIDRYNQMLRSVWANVDALEELKMKQRDDAFAQVEKIDAQTAQAGTKKTLRERYNDAANARGNSGFKLRDLRKAMLAADNSRLPELLEEYKKESEIYAKLKEQEATLAEQLNMQKQRRDQTVSAAAEKLRALQNELKVETEIAAAELAGDDAAAQRLRDKQRVAQIAAQIVAAGKHQYMTADELKRLEAEALKTAQEKVELENLQNAALKERVQLKNKEAAQEDYLYRTRLAELKLKGDEEGVKRLEREGYIKKYMAVLDAEKINRGFIAFCNLRMKQHSHENAHRIMEAVQQIPEIVECYNISGDYDFMLKIYVSDMKAYQEFVLRILGDLDCIGSLNSFFVLGEVKNSHQLPLS